MRIISRRMLRDFGEANPRAKAALDSWFHEAKNAGWRTPAEIKQQYGNASIVGNNRVVFNVAGNKFRLVVRIDYEFGIIFIRFIGTHSEYDDVDAEEI